MNNSFDSSDLQLDEKFGDYYSVSVLHSLFDGYLQPDLGSTPNLSLHFFDKMVETFREKVTEDTRRELQSISDLVRISSITLNSFTNTVYPWHRPSEHIKLMHIPPLDFHRPFQNVNTKVKSLRYINLFLGIPLPPETDPDQSTIDLPSYKFDDKLLSNPKFVKNYYIRLLSDLRDKIKTTIGELRYDEMILNSGWSTHLIGFYYKKISDNSYLYGFFNSGAGVQHHENHKDGKRVSVTKFYSGTLEDLKNMLAHVYTFAHLLNFFMTSETTERDLFYETLPASSSQEVHESRELLVMKWIYPQLSGSCTYFGFYHTIRYVFYSSGLKELFEQFREHIIKTSTDALLTYIEERPKIQQKHKTFLDMLFYENRDIKTIEFQERIEKLYTRYRTNVNEFTVHTTTSQNSLASFQFYEVKQDETNFIDILPYPQKVDKNVFETNVLEVTSKMDTVKERYIKGEAQMSRMEIYFFSIHVIRLLVYIITLPDTHYKQMDADFLKILPSKLCQAMLIWQYVYIKFFTPQPKNHSTSETIKFLFRFVLMRVNDVLEYIYFRPSKQKYKSWIVYDYSRKAFHHKTASLVVSSGDLFLSISPHFDLFTKYYDLLFPHDYYRPDGGKMWFDIVSYSQHLTDDVIDQSHDYNVFQNLTKNFIEDYSPFFSILMIMAPGNLDTVVYRTYEANKSAIFGTVSVIQNPEIIVNNLSERIGFSFSLLEEFYNASNITTIFEIVKYFKSDNLTQLNSLFDEASAISGQDSHFYDVHNGTPINIHRNLEGSEQLPLTLQSKATVLGNLSWGTQTLFFLNDSIDQYYNYKTQTSILLDTETITKMFAVLVDEALLVTLNILLFYHCDDLSDEQKNLIEKECLKRIELETKYVEVYKIVYLIVSNAENLTFEKNIFEELEDCFYKYEGDIVTTMQLKDGRISDLSQYDPVLHLFLMKFYAIYVSRMGDSRLLDHTMKAQNSKINSIDDDLRANFTKYLPKGNKETVVDISFQNDLVQITTHDAQGNTIQHTVLLGYIQKKQVAISDPFFRQFMLTYDKEKREIVGVSTNKKLGRVILTPFGDINRPNNTYTLIRVIRLKRDGKIQDVEMSEHQAPTHVTDQFFLGNTWLEKEKQFYKNVYFYKEEDASDVYVEFNSFVSPVTGRPLLMKMTKSGNVFYVDDDLTENLVCTDKNPFMINQWIYGLPYSFVYRTGLTYSIIYVDSQLSTGNLALENVSVRKWWIGEKVYKKCTNADFLEDVTLERRRYYRVAQIEYHGMGCIFRSIDDMRSYLLSCIVFQKPVCLDTLLPKYLVSVTDPSEDIVVKLLREGFANSPYSHYFTNMVKRMTTDVIIDRAFQERIDRKIYGSKFSFEDKSEDIRSDRPIRFQHNILGLDLFDEQTDTTKYSEAVTRAETELGQHAIGDKQKSIENMVLTLIEFTNSYKTCTSKSVNIDALREKLLELEDAYVKLLDNLESQEGSITEWANIPRDEFIVKYAHIFYQLLTVKTNYSVIKDIVKYVTSAECLEMRAVYDKINTSVLYEPVGTRPTEIILFEILFGWFIRKDQFKIYETISNSIDSNGHSNYLVHQLLMGKGKTAVIMPLLMLHYLYQNPHNIQNIFLVLPKHLTYVTHKMLFDKFYPVLNKTLVTPVTISRYSETDDEKNSVFLNYIGGVTEYDYTKKVYIMSDSSCKSIKLNTRYMSDDSKDILLKRMRESSVFIFDEFDNQYDPTTSDLNFPITADTLGNTPIIDISDQYLFTNFIIDRIATLNSDLSREKLKTEFKNYAELSTYGSHAALLDRDVTSALEFKNKCTVHHLLSQLFSCKNMIYLKDYGFPNENSHTEDMQNFAVPYNAVDTPVSGSEFSDTDIALLLTIFSYVYHQVRLGDVFEVLEKLQHSCDKFGNSVGKEHLDGYFKREKELLRLNSVLDIRDIPRDKLIEYARKVVYPKISQREFKLFYLEKEVLPKIHFTYTQDNCSFMDVITEKYALYKAAFTGTVHIRLPHYDNPNRVFINTAEDPLSAGATYAAILGIYHPDRQIISVPSKVYDTKDAMLDYLISLIKEKKYNVFIDSGAYLRLHKLDDVVKKFQKKLEDIRYIVYVDEEDVVTIWDRDTGYVEYTEQTNSFDKNKMFIYYDNKHIIGTDIKQPYHMSGLISVTNFNDLVDISQATFRMRNLNYGHTADFIINDIPGIDTNEKLLIHLHSKTYDKLHGSMQIKKYEQEIKSRYRVVSDEYHTENVFNKYRLFSDDETYENYSSNSVEDVLIELYKNHIRVGWLASSNDPLPNLSLDDLYDKITELLVDKIPFDKNINLNQTKEVESEQAKISNQEIAQVDREDDKDTVLRTALTRKDLTFSSYFSKDEWANMYDYVKIIYTTQREKITLLQLCNSRGVYFSPLFFSPGYKAFDWFFNSKSTHDPRRYRKMLNAYSYCYIKIHDTYLLITPRECEMLLFFLKNNENLMSELSEPVMIKDKRGNILYGEPNDVVTAKELLVRMILGKIMTTTENLFITAYLRENPELLKFLEELEKFYMVPLYDHAVYDEHIKKTVSEFSDVLQKVYEKDSEAIALVFGDTFELSDNDISQKFVSLILDKFVAIYESETTLKRALLDVTPYIDKPVRISMFPEDTPDNQMGGYLSYLEKKIKKYKSRYLKLKRRHH